ncbi:MAG: hypothetical protein ABSB82_14065 [Terriglobia bacterium]
MSRFKVGALVLGVCVLLAASIKGQAQTPATPDSPAATSTVAASPQAVVPRLMKFNGVLRDVTGKPVTGPVDVTFALYSTDAGGNPLWFETQSVEADEQGRYSALIGVMHSEGLPMDLFTSGEARWLGVQVANEVEQKPRVLLLSVPYALKAADAETLGGLPASSYMLSPSASNWAGSAGQTTSTASVPAASTGNEGTSAKKGVSRKNTACSSLTADGNASANQIAFYSAPCALSEDANLVDVGGKVGIGTADPTEGGQVGSRFTLSTATDAATGFSIFTGAAKRFAINTQSSGGFLFYDGQGAVWNPGLSQVGGNVGIGTADPTMSGQVGSRLTLSTAADSATGFSIFTGSAKRFALNTQSSGGFLIYDGGGGAWNPGLAQVGGKVGIGTITPTAALEVNGAAKFDQPVTFAGGQTFPGAGTVTSISTGAGLTGGPITTSGTISIPALGVANSMLANPSLTINTGSGLTGGGQVYLGESLNLGMVSNSCSPGSAITALPGPSCNPFASIGTNYFNGLQTITVSSGTGLMVSNTGTSGTAIEGYSSATANNGYAGYFLNSGGGTILDANDGSHDILAVDTNGVDIRKSVGKFTNDPVNATVQYELVSINQATGTAKLAGPGYSGGFGAVGIAVADWGTSSNYPETIAVTSGETYCVFDNTPVNFDFFQVSPTTAGYCHDAGPNWPVVGQVLGIVTDKTKSPPEVYLFGIGTGVEPGVIATNANCSSSASPAACGSAGAGSVAIAGGATTLVVDTSAVTANSQIMLQEDSSLGAKLSVTCNTTAGRTYTVSARTAGTSFTITSSSAPATNPACLSYVIIN